MKGSRGKVDKIIGADHFPLSIDLDLGSSFQDKEGLFKVRMDMGIGLAAGFNLAMDYFKTAGPESTWAEQAPVGGSGMAGRRIGRQIPEMGDVFVHLNLLRLSAFSVQPFARNSKR
jgi:hypothetical protein